MVGRCDLGDPEAVSTGQRWPRLLVYVAGPFSPTVSQKARGLSVKQAIEDNTNRAIIAGYDLAALGVMPIVPHTAHGGHPMLETIQPYDHWIEATEELLMRCDLALFLPRWEESRGARHESNLCAREGIAQFGSVLELQNWLCGNSVCVDAGGVEITIANLPKRLADRLARRIRDTDRAPAGTAGELPEIPKGAPPSLSFGKIDV